MKTVWMLLSLTLASALFAAPPPNSNDEYVQKLRQAIVDLEDAMRNYSDRGDARLAAQLKALEKSVADFKRATATSDGRIEGRVVELERTVSDLKTRIAQVGGGPDAKKNLERELADIRAAVNRIATELSKPPSEVMFCEFNRVKSTNLNTYPMKSVKTDRDVVRSDASDNIVDAMNNACTKCGPRDFQGDYGYYSTTTCAYAQCYWKKTGELVTSYQNALRLVPQKCRMEPVVEKPKAAPQYACSVTFSYQGYLPSQKQSEPPRVIASPAAASAIDGACRACAEQARDKLTTTYIPQMATWWCTNLVCKYDGQEVGIPRNAIPYGCLFGDSRGDTPGRNHRVIYQ